jgi:crotonobetainyl-CoA:carnitine CoA-transferase CaiB-like acyl-CoA transferase
VLDLGVIVAGAEAGRLLADHGADVIKIESRDHLDGSRLATIATGMSESFARGHRNKRSLGLDLRSDHGKEIFRRLAEVSDVVLSNFKPGTLESLGIDHAALSACNEGIVTVESSAFGESPAFRGFFGYGPLVRAVSGLTHQWRYPDLEEGFGDGLTVFPDHLAGRLSASIALALVLRRRRTGRGGDAKTAQIDIIMNAAAEAIAELDRPRGLGDAPRGVFAAAGDPDQDQWIYLEVDGDPSFRALCESMARPDLAGDRRFASASRRVEHRAELEEIVKVWTAGLVAETMAAALQRAGVKAAPVVHEVNLPDDPDLVARSAFTMLAQPHYPEGLRVHGAEVEFTSLGMPLRHPAPLLAEHTREVVADVLGMADDQIDALVKDRVLFVHEASES